jgi:ferric-dicitrate binding protein FerR (iron transport regulator)
MNDDYLWDRSGEPDPATQRLEELLVVYRHKVQTVPVRNVRRRPALRWLAAAAMIAIVLVVFARTTARNSWRATILSGNAPTRTLRTGEELNTHDARVRLESRAIGSIELAPRTKLILAENGERLHRLSLIYGSLHARTTSAPGLFVVNTAFANAVDLGCEYTLTINNDGSGLLRVTAGWVELENARRSLVPRGAAATILATGELTAPYFENAAPELRDGVVTFQRVRGPARTTALINVLRHARKRDALTLINLFSRANPAERLYIFDRLNELVPAPPGLHRDDVLDWNARTTEPWWPSVVKAARVPPMEKKGKQGWW